MTASSPRIPVHPIHPLFLNRWSPRAMTGQEMPLSELMPLFEAARWSPSGGNGQPWRFVFARKGTPHWQEYFDLLVPGNQLWAKNASVLVVLLSLSVQENSGKPAPSHTLDAGAAWMSLALQGSLNGLAIHGIGGFDREKARQVLGIPPEYKLEAMIAIGYPAPVETLPENFQAMEKPNARKNLEEIVFEGKWPQVG
jgi:nitroreductase